MSKCRRLKGRKAGAARDAANAVAGEPGLSMRVIYHEPQWDYFPVSLLFRLVGPFLSQLGERERSNGPDVPRFYGFDDLRIRRTFWK